MSRILLLRHAKAAWAAPGERDYDRRLDTVGRDEAERIGQAMLAGGYVPDRVLCSAASRARQTWEGVAQAVRLPSESIAFTDDLYTADPAGYVEIVRNAGDAGSLLVVGHNPMIEDVATAFAAEGEKEALATLSQGFPTAGLAVISLSTPLREAMPREGYLEAFIIPAAL